MNEGPDGGHDAVVMLAAAVVLAFGAAFCAFIILSVADNARWATLVTVAAFGGGIILIALLTLDPRKTRREGLWRRIRRLLGRRDPTTEYRASPRMKTKIIEFGTNQPPSVESVREIKESCDGMKNWSPKSGGGE